MPLPLAALQSTNTHTAVTIDFSKNDSPATNRMEVQAGKQPSHSISCVFRALHFAALLAGWCCWSGGSCSTSRAVIRHVLILMPHFTLNLDLDKLQQGAEIYREFTSKSLTLKDATKLIALIYILLHCIY